MCRSRSCWCAVGIAPFCLTCRDLISGGLCGPSADPVNRENTQRCAAGAAMGGAALHPGCCNGRGHRQAGPAPATWTELSWKDFLPSQLQHLPPLPGQVGLVCWEEPQCCAAGASQGRTTLGQPAAMAGEACEQTSTCWEGVAGSALCTAGGSLRAALPVRGMEHLQLLRVSLLLG